MTKVKTNEVPGRAKLLFIKLYCERRGGETSENIHSAAQSWLSLSHRKKEHFYETVSTKSAIKKAQLIIQTEPFLKAKFPSTSRKRKHAENQKQQNGQNAEVAATGDNMSLLHDDTIMECDSYSNSLVGDDVDDTLPDTRTQDIHSPFEGRTERCESPPLSNETQPVSSPLQEEDTTLQERAEDLTPNEPQISDAEKQRTSYMSIIDDEETLSATEDIFEEEAEKVPLLEPILPVAKSGKDLFELFKSRNGSNKAYESLTSKEKIFYGRAVLAIKRDYVQKYKEYLESLTSRQLFDYYRKVFFD